MKLLHFPWLRRLLGRGVNSDIRPELLPDGFAHEAINIRPESISGDTGAVTAIGGEEVASFEQQAQNTGYHCIGSASCHQYLVEFWAGQGLDPLVKINGQIVAQSPNIPYRYDRPLQLAVVDDVRRGVIYPADHTSDPLYWDVQELLDNVGTPLYFQDYTTDINSVLLTANPEFPVHTGNVEVSPGLPVGQYQYALRYVSPLGDRSNHGPWTPLITVPLWQDRKLTWQQNVIPGLSTVGGSVSPDQPTGYGVQLQFRIDNQQGYSAVEVIRRRYNTGDGKSIEEVVDRIDIAPGQVSVQTFVDPTDAIASPEVIPDDESEQRLITFTAPKAVEYADRRLQYGNFTTGTKDPGITFIENNGEKMVPITKAIFTQPNDDPNSIYPDGYSDPVNNTYMKTFARGEKYGIGVMVWDRYSAKYYVTEAYDSFKFPNRRDPKTGDSATYSDNPIWAATTNCNNVGGVRVDQTFDAYSQGAKSKFPVNTGYNFVNRAISAGAYSPFGPVDPVQSGINSSNDQTRVGIPPCTQNNAGTYNSPSWTDVTQYVWSPMYHALGGALYGVENLPRGAKVMSIMRTEPANRAVAQGIAVYDLTDSTNGLLGNPEMERAKNRVRISFPDFKSFEVPQSTQDDLVANPQKYRLQFVAPVGVTSEAYGWLGASSGSTPYNGAVADMLTYAGIQYDQGQVNYGEPTSGMAYQADGGSPAPPSNYVGYGAWRGNIPTTGIFHNSTDQGNKLIEIVNVEEKINGRSTHLLVTLSEDLYFDSNIAITEDFNSSITRSYHQPMYVVNLVKEDAEVADLTIDRYINTGYHIKLESCIGVATGGNDKFYLLNERWEDVLGENTTQTRYVWVQNGLSAPVAWLQVVNSSFTGIVPTILNDISNNGFWLAPDGTQVYGVCTAGMDTAPSSGWRNSSCFVEFGQYGGLILPTPDTGARILVKYNKNAPIKFFGGDCTIAPSIDCFVDGFADVNTSGTITSFGTCLWVNPRLPYMGYRKNPQYNMPITSTLMASDYNQYTKGLRQWVVLWDAEQRSAIRYGAATTATSGPYSWPHVGYLIKPYAFDSNNPDSGMFPYPPINVGGVNVPLIQDYTRGGFVFSEAYNSDYWKQSEVDGFGIPFDDQGGIVERTSYPTGIIASMEVDPTLTDVPGIRTFIDTNLKVLSEENGEIKAMGTALAEGSRNLYAFTERGVVRVLTQKNILSGASGEIIATQTIDGYWGPEMWISRSIGMPDQMWRLLVKTNAAAGSSFIDSFFWGDRSGMYRLTGNTIQNITLNRFIADALPLLRAYPSGYQSGAIYSSGGYNRNYDEVMFSFASELPVSGAILRRVLVFDASLGEWIGEFSYQFDSYAMHLGLLYGSKNLQTYLLDTGDTINGDTRVASVVVPFVGDLGNFKEFCRWRIMGTVAEAKPDQIEILNENYEVIVRKDATINGSPYWTKYYDGWEGWADRVLASFDAARPLPQSSMFYLRLIWNTPGKKAAIGVSAQLKNIK